MNLNAVRKSIILFDYFVFVEGNATIASRC